MLGVGGGVFDGLLQLVELVAPDRVGAPKVGALHARRC